MSYSAVDMRTQCRCGGYLEAYVDGIRASFLPDVGHASDGEVRQCNKCGTIWTFDAARNGFYTGKKKEIDEKDKEIITLLEEARSAMHALFPSVYSRDGNNYLTLDKNTERAIKLLRRR